MTNSRESSAKSKVPVLIEPTEEAVVDGSRVAFAWEPLDGARSYTVQVAAEPSFKDIVHEEQAGKHTSIEVRNVFPTDEATYFWRVLSRDADGSIHGADNIESFISGTSADSAQGMKSPDQSEDVGPLGQLTRAARAEAGREISQDPRFISEEIKLGVEHEGVQASQIIGFVLAVAVALALSIVVLIQYFAITAGTVRFESAGLSGYPELQETRLQAIQKLSQYGAVEGASDRYRIPIDRAMELEANEAYENSGTQSYSDELDLMPRELSR